MAFVFAERRPALPGRGRRLAGPTCPPYGGADARRMGRGRIASLNIEHRTPNIEHRSEEDDEKDDEEEE